MTMTEYYINQAITYITESMPIPLDLFYKLLGQGIDVDALERKYG